MYFMKNIWNYFKKYYFFLKDSLELTVYRPKILINEPDEQM